MIKQLCENSNQIQSGSIELRSMSSQYIQEIHEELSENFDNVILDKNNRQRVKFKFQNNSFSKQNRQTEDRS